MSSTRSKNDAFAWITFAFKALCVALMIGAPLAGVWLASSLAAFANRATWLPVVAGLFLFPGLPLIWEGIGAWRYRVQRVKKKRFLTFGDRLILRTLAINALFLGVLLVAFPSRAFVALSTRGDWMLEGHHGPTAESIRRGLLSCAGAVEWLYRAANDNPYREGSSESDKVDPTPAPAPTPAPRPTPAPIPIPIPIPTPTPTPSPTPVPSASGVTPPSSATPDPEPAPQTPVTNGVVTYPMPAKIHPVVAAMPREVETSVESIGKYIAEREHDPVQRVKALHDWVADRIAYDTPNYVAGRVPQSDRDPDAVFRSRVGVCAGYAKLLVQLGKVTGDEIVYVVGDARSEDSPMEGEPHAWNAVKINGAWYLIDPTWNAGSSDGAAFKKQYSTDYLFTPPDHFAITHFPDANKWQLLEKPLTRAEFFRRPVLAPAFFTYGLTLRSPDHAQVTTGSSLDLALDNPHKVFLIADFEPRGGGASNGKRSECRGDRHTQAHCDFPGAGTYDVRLFANTKQFGSYTYVGSVQVNARP